MNQKDRKIILAARKSLAQVRSKPQMHAWQRAALRQEPTVQAGIVQMLWDNTKIWNWMESLNAGPRAELFVRTPPAPKTTRSRRTRSARRNPR